MKTTPVSVGLRYGLLGLAVLFLGNLAHAATTYELVDLGVPPRFNATHATAINSKGQVTVTADLGGLSRAYYYDGTLHAIPIAGSTGSVASDLNDNGVFVGTATYTSPNPDLGYIYNVNTSSLTTLASPFSTTGSADRVNNAGTVLGHANLYAPGGYIDQGGTLTGLDNQTGYLGGYGEINNHNQILASSSTLQSFYVYTLGSGALPADVSLLNWNLYSAAKFNDNATIAGFVIANKDLFLTTASSDLNTSTVDQGKIGLGITGVGDINNLNSVVGTFAVDGSTTHPFLFSGSGFVDLNDVIAAFPGWTLEDATGINDHGQIVGTGLAPDGLEHAYLLNPTLTPVPEPATYGLAGAAGLMLLSWHRQRRKRQAANLNSAAAI